MKSLIAPAIWGVLLLGPLNAVSDDLVSLAGIGSRVASPPSIPAVFGNREEQLDLRLSSGVPAVAASLRADLFQVAGSLAMPLAHDLLLQADLAPGNAASRQLHVTLKLPDVKRQARVVVRLAFVPKAAPAIPVPAGELRFDVYPENLTKELTDLLASSKNAVTIFGPGQKLRHFLTAHQVTFSDEGSDVPNRFDPARFYFGEMATAEQAQRVQDVSTGGRVAVFAPEDSLPPGVYAEPSGSGTFVRVTLPLLDNLAQDPRDQLALIKITRLLASSPASTN